MKAIQYKASILMTGFLNGMNFIPSNCGMNKLSRSLGSLDITYTFPESGPAEDAKNLSGDWAQVRNGFMNSFDAAKAELAENAG